MRMPTFKGGPGNSRVPLYSYRDKYMGHQLYLGPKCWFLWKGEFHAFWLTLGAFSVSWTH